MTCSSLTNIEECFTGKNILKKQQVGVNSATVFCYCSAAFNTIDHEMLFNKLKLYEVKPDNILWFNSYL